MNHKSLVLVLNNIRSTYNVGAILRTAEGLGVSQVVYSGYTPRYNDASLLPHLKAKLNRQIERSALGAEKMIAQETTINLSTWLNARKAGGWTIVGLENNLALEEQKKRLILGTLDQKLTQNDRLTSQVLADTDKIVLVLGEEVNGIPMGVREQLDYFLEIPMVGRKESFNVSVATGIALWELSSLA